MIKPTRDLRLKKIEADISSQKRIAKLALVGLILLLLARILIFVTGMWEKGIAPAYLLIPFLLIVIFVKRRQIGALEQSYKQLLEADRSPDKGKRVILFIHGFGSSSKCWKKMFELLAADDRITSQYELATWDYPTKWIELNLLARIPDLHELSRALSNEIDSPTYRGRELTLVGHSQGGLVIQKYLADRLAMGEAFTLRDVRQAILIATPCRGSTTGMFLRVVLSTLFPNSQERILRVFSPEVANMVDSIRKNIVGATIDSDKTWRLPIHALCGMQDNIVPEASARGVFDSVISVKGTHFTILKPEGPQDPRYVQLVKLLLDPGGHAHRFEVESYENVLRVEPRARETIRTKSKKNPRTVEFDDYATLIRKVRFAASNRCQDRYKISYGTHNNGAYVDGHYPTHRNESTAEELRIGDDSGVYYQFKFTPRSGEEYSVMFDIYGAFTEGERDIHFHPGTYDSRLRRLSYALDLSAYVAAGYVVSLGPSCFVQPKDVVHDSEVCRLREGAEPLKVVSQTSDGIYRWELTDIEGGVVDIVWDVTKASDAAAAGVAAPKGRK